MSGKKWDLAVDCRLSGSTGIGRYVREIMPYVVDTFGAERLLLIGHSPELGWAKKLIESGARHIESEARVFRPAEQLMFREVERQARVLWCPHFCMPLRPRIPVVTTVHDLIPLHVATGWKGRVRRWGAAVYLRSVRLHATSILTVSHCVAGELSRELGIEPGRIRPIHNGVTHDWFAAKAARSQGGRYAIYVGNVSPHKNTEALFAAYERISSRVDHRLVIVGEERGFSSGGVLHKWLGRLGNRVEWRPRLAEDELRRLVNGADLLVMPSLEEGFGLPPLEAMACGCPVLTSDCPALLETAEQGAHRFRLGLENDLGVQLERLLTDERLRTSKIEEGRLWAERFSWERSGRATAAVLQEVVEGRR
jgi:glycosyltransferase involved in cell wall biosynthesis